MSTPPTAGVGCHDAPRRFRIDRIGLARRSISYSCEPLAPTVSIDVRQALTRRSRWHPQGNRDVRAERRAEMGERGEGVVNEECEQCLRPVDEPGAGRTLPIILKALKQGRRANAGREGTTRAHRSSWFLRRRRASP